MNRKIKKIALIVIACLLVILVAVVLLINVIAKVGIQKGATYALGVDTSVDGVHIGLLSGNFRIAGLTIDNPEGFTDAHIMKSGKFTIDVKPASLLSKNVRLNKFEIDGLELIIEQKVKGNNVSPILKHLEELSGEEEAGEEKEEAEGKNLIIDEIVIKNVVASVRLPSLAGKLGRAKIKIPEIRIKDFGAEKEKKSGVFQVTRRIFSEVVMAVIDKSGGVLPDDLIGSLSDGIAGLSSAVYKGGKAVVEGAASGVKTVGEGAASGVKTVGEGAASGVKSVGEGAAKTLKGVKDKIPLIGK